MESLITRTAEFVKKSLADGEKGHDWLHIERVWKNAKLIAVTESGDTLLIHLGALLHDIADAKFHEGNEEIGPRIAHDWVLNLGLSEDIADQVANIVRYTSFKKNIDGQQWTSPELQVVQDADRLDAIGAIGIARAFHYGGFKNREIYNPEILPRPDMTRAEYKTYVGTTINHFPEKLFKLKDLMNTKTGKRLAEERHQVLVQFHEQFMAEMAGTR